MRPLIHYSAIAAALAVFVCASAAFAQIRPPQKISSLDGDFTGQLDDGDLFGTHVSSLGDLDGDGVTDILVGAVGDDDGSAEKGALWILFLNTNGTVKSHAKISETEGGFAGVGSLGFHFGVGAAAVDDLDDDGIPEIVALSRRSQHVLFMNRNGTVKSNTSPQLSHNYNAVTLFTDLMDDGVSELVMVDNTQIDLDFALIILDGNGGLRTGPSFLRTDPVFGGELEGTIRLSIATIDDYDHNGVPDLAIGNPFGDGGSVWITSVNASAQTGLTFNPAQAHRIGAGRGGFTGELSPTDAFGTSVASVGDLNGDGIGDLVVGAPGDSDGGPRRGALWVLFMDESGSVQSEAKISSTEGGFTGQLLDGDEFGSSVALLGDLDGDGIPDLAVGAPRDDSGGDTRGAVWILFSLGATGSQIDLVERENIPNLGDNVRVEAEVKGVSETVGVEVHFRRGGDPSFFAAPMTEESPGRYVFEIPAFAVNERGVEYFVTATNKGGATSRAPAQGVEFVPVYTADGLDITLPSGPASNSYELVSFPLDLDEKAASTVLEDDLGSYDPSEWRFYDTSTGSNVEFSGDGPDLNPGAAFWWLAREANRRVNTGPGVSVATNKVISKQLRSGWTFVGNPFSFPILLDNLSLKSGDAVEMLAYRGGWVGTDTLSPFSGIIISSVLGDSLRINPSVDPGSDAGSATSSKHATELWSVRVIARKGLALDSENRFGVSLAASNEWDTLDRPEPPVIGDYVSVYFPHPDWAVTAARYRSDIRYPISDTQSWPIEVVAASPGEATLTFDGIEDLPLDLDVLLHDPATGLTQNLRDDPEHSIVLSEAKPRKLSIEVGKGGFAQIGIELPTSDLRLSTFPNPFREATTIVYEGPLDEPADVIVFDVLGREVARLDPGAGHAVTWDGRDSAGRQAPPGVYLVQVRSGVVRKTIFVVKTE